ncbi:MAG: glycosyltransferase family 4 protein [Alphaproteobacteria bacterium]|nr:glycosyltransferase family 4 protein [Alphaproteobacteria bacterium]
MTQQPPIYVCVTNLLESRYQKKTGIPRVEYEVAQYLAARGATVVAWSARQRQFRAIDFAAVLESITRAQSLDLETICTEPQRPHPLRAAKRLLASTSAALARHLSVTREPGRTLAHTAFRRIAAAWPHLSPPQRRAIATTLRLAEDTDRLGYFIDVLVETRTVTKAPAVVDFPRDARLLLLGIWWDQRPLDEIARLKRERGLRFIALVHDLVPIRRPQFFTDETGRARFTRFIDGLLATADTLCATSAHVAGDVEAYARERAAALQPVVRVPLCSDLRRSVVPRHTAALARHALEPGRFVVYVSTINPRKNHLFAYRLWRRLVEELGEAAPTLVFVGQRGWRYEALFETMTADTLMWNRKLRFVEGPTDEEMAWLYANCAFSIFPSLYEGWGLPILESLSFGKYCLAANNTALPEAGQGLAFHADAEDEATWLAELRRVISAPGYLDAANTRIRERFVTRSWDEVGAEMLTVIRSPTSL